MQHCKIRVDWALNGTATQSFVQFGFIMNGSNMAHLTQTVTSTNGSMVLKSQDLLSSLSFNDSPRAIPVWIYTSDCNTKVSACMEQVGISTYGWIIIGLAIGVAVVFFMFIITLICCVRAIRANSKAADGYFALSNNN